MRKDVRSEKKGIPPEEQNGYIPDAILELLREKAEERAERHRKAPSGKVRDGSRILPDKNATPGDGDSSISHCLDDIRPAAFAIDKYATAATDADELRVGTLSNFGDLTVQSGNRFENQLAPIYVPQAFPS